MRAVLYAQPEKWNNIIEIIAASTDGIQVIGLSYHDLSQFEENDVIFSLEEVQRLYENHLIDGVIQGNPENQMYFWALRHAGIKDIYVVPTILLIRKQQGRLGPGEKMVYRYEETLPEWWQIEFSLADHCNMNCRGCTHFSSLVKKPVFADKEQFKTDMQQLKKYFSHLHYFYLQGGEPLLNPDLPDYVHIVKEAFPYTQQVIITNGLLLFKIGNEVWETLRENNVRLCISDYSCLDKKKTADFLQPYHITPEFLDGKGDFFKYLNLKGDSEPVGTFYKCSRRHCTFLQNGRIAACCQPLLAHYFNEYFGERLGEEGAIDLYEDGLNGWQLAERLFSPMDACRYCTDDVPYKWGRVEKDADIKDWCAKGR